MSTFCLGLYWHQNGDVFSTQGVAPLSEASIWTGNTGLSLKNWNYPILIQTITQNFGTMFFFERRPDTSFVDVDWFNANVKVLLLGSSFLIMDISSVTSGRKNAYSKRFVGIIASHMTQGPTYSALLLGSQTQISLKKNILTGTDQHKLGILVNLCRAGLRTSSFLDAHVLISFRVS